MSRTIYGSTSAPNYITTNGLTVGESTIPRTDAITSSAIGTGSLRLTYFTATRTETVTGIRALTTATPAAATPTLIRMGLYEVAANGNLTLAASTPNDTTLFAVANTPYTKALSAPYGKVAGHRYAFGIVVVTAAAAPQLASCNMTGPSAEHTTIEPRLCAALNSQTDLPSSIPSASLVTLSQMVYAVLVP